MMIDDNGVLPGQLFPDGDSLLPKVIRAFIKSLMKIIPYPRLVRRATAYFNAALIVSLSK